MKLSLKKHSKVLIQNSTIVFLNSIPKTPIWDKFGPETQSCFVLNDTPYLVVFKGTDSEFDNYFLKFHPKNTFLGKLVPKSKTALFDPKNVFGGENLRKQLSNSESSPLNTSIFRVSFKTMYFEVWGPNLPKKGKNLKFHPQNILRTEFEETFAKFRICTTECYYAPRFV